MNENIIQLLQNGDKWNRALGVQLAVNEGWSVDDIFKYLLLRVEDDYEIGNYNLDFDEDNDNCRLWDVRLTKEGTYKLLSESDYDKLPEYKAKFIELILSN